MHRLIILVVLLGAMWLNLTSRTFRFKGGVNTFLGTGLGIFFGWYLSNSYHYLQYTRYRMFYGSSNGFVIGIIVGVLVILWGANRLRK
ncbi:hypothetical protein OAT16_11730 [Prolixibacteraceae bacterium]|nr:hypothetical protein [Prolixibacteraceae bacterium]